MLRVACLLVCVAASLGGTFTCEGSSNDDRRNPPPPRNP